MQARNGSGKQPTYLRQVCGILGLGLWLLMSGARASTIFDDDYVPPKHAEPASRPSVLQPPPSTPDVRPGSSSQPTSAVARRPAPDPVSRAKSRKLLEEVYSTELKDHSTGGRRKLAEALLNDAGKTVSGSADHFMLLSGAVQSAEEAGNLPVALEAAKRLADVFEVDGLAIEVKAAVKVFSEPAHPVVNQAEGIDELCDLADHVMDADALPEATLLESALQRASAGTPEAPEKQAVRHKARELLIRPLFI